MLLCIEVKNAVRRQGKSDGELVGRQLPPDKSIRVFMITSEWPWPGNPNAVPFIVRQVEFLRKAGVEIEIFSFRGAQNPFNYMRAWRRAQKKLRQNSYDLIHAQWSQSA